MALLAVGAWVGTQRQSISTIEARSLALQKRIAAARAAGPATDPAQAGKPSRDKSADSKQPLDWKKLATQMEEMQRDGGMGDMRTMMRLQQRFQAMSTEEILASLDQIAALDLPAGSRSMLQNLLIGPLIQKDPELALTRFADQLRDERGGMGWQLSSAFTEWAKKDTGKATAWFDQQIAAGIFDSKSLDGKSRVRLQFEGALIKSLVSSDPDAAGQRLGALPEDQRGEALQQLSHGGASEEDQPALAKLIRDQLTDKDKNQTFSQMASNAVSQGGYPAATAFLDRIGATPAERAAAAEQTANSRIQQLSYQKGVTREDIDSMREWVSTQAPGTADSTTGKALIQATSNDRFKFADAAALAVQYQERSGNDDVLVNFLDGWQARQNKDAAILLADKITDEARRAEILKKLK